MNFVLHLIKSYREAFDDITLSIPWESMHRFLEKRRFSRKKIFLQYWYGWVRSYSFCFRLPLG